MGEAYSDQITARDQVLRTSSRTLFTKTRTSSSKASRSAGETRSLPRTAAVESTSSGLANSTSISCVTLSYIEPVENCGS